jgi:putative heme-binding domain-containing protein
MPAGDRTGAGSPTGVVMNEGDALGEKYRGLLLSADAGRNTIFGYHPSVKKSGYDLGTRSNFITSLSNDNENYVWDDSVQNTQKEKWFRPSDVMIGTEGAIYVADWYDPVVGGHQMKDSIGYGRIYRIAPKNKKLVAPKIDLSSVPGQIEAFKNSAVNIHNLAFEKLKQQGDAVFEQVKAILEDKNPYLQARAIWLLSQLGKKGREETEHLLNNPNELLRVTAFRALRQTVQEILPYAKRLSKDKSPFVRREVAIALRDLPYADKKEVLLSLASQYDGEDRWYLETLGSAMEANAATFYDELKVLLGEKNINSQQWKKPMIDFAWRLHPANAIADIFERVADSSLSPDERSKMLTALAFINDKAAANAMLLAANSNLQDVKEQAAYWLSFRQSNDWNDLLDWSKVTLNTSYQRRLSQMKVKRQVILDERQSLNERKWRTEEMAADSIGGQMLIGLAAENKVPKSILQFVEASIFNNPDQAVRIQAGRYFKRPGAGKIYSIEEIVKLKPDAQQGKLIFEQRCATCHKMGNEGNSVGPELTMINKKFDRTALLDAVINPDAAIVFGYEPWLINTKSGESVYGFLMEENKNGVVLKDIAGKKHIIPASRISLKEKQNKSLMPDPIANGLSENDLANVVEFLLKVI